MTATKLVLGCAMLFGMGAPLLAQDMPTTRPATQPTGAYVCPMCHTSSDKPGKCPECGTEMKKASEVNKDTKKHQEYRIPVDPSDQK